MRMPFTFDGRQFNGRALQSGLSILQHIHQRKMTSMMSLHAPCQINGAMRPCKQALPTLQPRHICHKVNAICLPSAQKRFLSVSTSLNSSAPLTTRHRKSSVVVSSSAASSPAGTDLGPHLGTQGAVRTEVFMHLQCRRQPPRRKTRLCLARYLPVGTGSTLSSTCEKQNYTSAPGVYTACVLHFRC